MLITADDKYCIKFVKAKIELLVGSFPNLKWDINMTVASWMLMLSDMRTTDEEFTEAIRRTIKNGFEDWEVNLSLVVSIIVEIRKERRDLINTQKYLQKRAEMNANKISNQKMKEYIADYKKWSATNA